MRLHRSRYRHGTVAAGIPKDEIVLGFKSEDMRRHTEFAVASITKSLPIGRLFLAD